MWYRGMFDEHEHICMRLNYIPYIIWWHINIACVWHWLFWFVSCAHRIFDIFLSSAFSFAIVFFWLLMLLLLRFFWYVVIGMVTMHLSFFLLHLFTSRCLQCFSYEQIIRCLAGEKWQHIFFSWKWVARRKSLQLAGTRRWISHVNWWNLLLICEWIRVGSKSFI